MLGQRADAFIGKDGGAFAPVFEPAQQGQDRRRVGFFSLRGNLREDFFDGAKLFRFVVDDKIPFVAEPFNVLAQNPDAEGMEGADGGAGVRGSGVWRLGFWEKFVYALLHFARGLVGESDGENVSGRNALGDEVGDAKRDDAGLAGARPGQDQHRAVQRFDGLALVGIERIQIQHARGV